MEVFYARYREMACQSMASALFNEPPALPGWQLEGAISGRTPLKPAEVLALEGGNAAPPAADGDARTPAPPPQQSRSKEGRCAAGASAEAPVQQQQQAEDEQHQQKQQEQQQPVEEHGPVLLEQGVLAPAAPAAPAQPLEEVAGTPVTFTEASAAVPLAAHQGLSPAK